MTPKQKLNLTQKYMTNVPEITEYQKEWIRKATAHYIFVEKNVDGSHKCYCDCCMHEVNLGKTHHKAKVECPSCGHELEVVHLWRKAEKNIETIDWVAIPKVIDGNTLMLRYVGAHRYGIGTHVFEAARIVFDTRQKTQHHFCLWNGGWTYTKQSYFVEFNMWNYREWCCLPAEPYKPTWNREIKKLDCFKYFPDFMEYVDKFNYVSDGLKFISYKAPLYEKLIKAGCEEIVKEDGKRDLCNIGIEYNTKETSLLKMLGLNKNQFRILRNNPSVKTYRTIKEFNNMKIDEVELIVETNTGKEEISIINNHKLSLIHTLRYFKKVGCEASEWTHYLSMLKALKYPLDNAYLYPKDFRKMDDNISDEYEKMIYGEEDSERDKIIRKISKALQKMKDLKDFFDGSDGLQVIIPETSKDFRRESKYMHNCVKTYPNRVAKGNTLVFFIRKIDDPTAPYVTMEYCHGKVKQCMFAYNVPVNDSKIIDFAERLAQKLVSQNILAA